MDAVNLIFAEPISVPSPLEKISAGEKLCDDGKEKFAKDFESIFINKLLDVMQTTIGDWGLEKDGASEQINGMFSMYLARQVAENGGLGLWKEIYSFLDKADNANATVESLDSNI